MQNKSFNSNEKTATIFKPHGKRILFANVPADGHFNPLSGIAMQLKSAGYDVRWYSSSTYGPKLKKMQIPFYPYKKALNVTGENVDSIFPERTQIKDKIKKLNFDFINFFGKRGPEYYADIKEIHASFPFDLLIADCTFTGISFVKDLMNIPVIAVGVMPLFGTSRDLAPAGLGITPSYSWMGKIKQALMRAFTNKVLFRTTNKVIYGILEEHGIDHNGKGIFDIVADKSDLLLQSGTPGFEYYRSDLGSNVRFIGPLLPYNDGKSRDQWFDNRLNRYERVVLVTQGTVEKDVEKILIPTLEAFRNSDTLVVATTGGSQTQMLKERFQEDNFIIEDFIPFGDVMPYADVYVSNGGYGGVMIAIENSLPMVVAGVHEGKNEINARIGYFNLGINLKTETPSPEAIRSAVETIFANEDYKNNVVSLGKEFSSYDPYNLCEQYVAALLHQCAPKAASLLVPVTSN